MTAAGLACAACGTDLPPNSRFCNECGAPIAQAHKVAEYKQVTVLFADVVHSMDIAAAVGAERLREIMAELVNAPTTVVKRLGGTVDKFTGEGSWRFSVRQSRWRITLSAHVWPRWISKGRHSAWPPRFNAATVSR